MPSKIVIGTVLDFRDFDTLAVCSGFHSGA